MVQEMKQQSVIIIGAGVGGISMAIKLKEKLKFTNFTIYEKAWEVGGTWRDNTYPGCSCDVPVHWYSLSSEINTEWTQHYAEQAEIWAYWRSLAEKHGLYPHIVFGTHVKSLTWDKATQRWHVEIETTSFKGEQKDRKIIEAKIVVSAAGGFVGPAYPDLEGGGVFRGESFHSAAWNHSIDLRGKRVGVIGNGCSAAQFIPRISQDSSVQVINFCRTPSWVVPKHQFQYSAISKWIFRYIPLAARMYRIFLYFLSDIQYRIWIHKNARMRNMAEKQILNYMKMVAPKRYHDQLTPHYPLGCKRIIVDPGYYASLHRPNVELIWGGVKEIVKEGLITNDGKMYGLDVIIYGTGYQIMNPDMRITGVNGQTLHEYFGSRDGPEAYFGTTVPRFPNMFTLLGPNSASGHASAIFSEEQQMEYALQLMRPVIEGKVQSFELRPEVSHTYNDNLQRRLSETTWAHCSSYYRTAAGKNFVTFPGPMMMFWYLTRKVQWSDYIAVGGERWERERKAIRFVKFGLGVATGLLMYLWKRGRLNVALGLMGL